MASGPDCRVRKGGPGMGTGPEGVDQAWELDQKGWTRHGREVDQNEINLNSEVDCHHTEREKFADFRRFLEKTH